MKENKNACPAVQAQDRQGKEMKGESFMPLQKFITIIKGKQAEYDRFCRIVEDIVLLYLLFAGVWSLCYAVSFIFTKWGVA